MKKNYIQPATEIMECGTSNILVGSGDLNKTVGNKNQLTKPETDWDDDSSSSWDIWGE